MKYHQSVRSVPMTFPPTTPEERQRLGLDTKDELWDGEWHFVNPPKSWHWQLNSDLFLILAPLARRVGLTPAMEGCGVFGELDHNWRVPDQVYAKPEDVIEEGVTSAELVVEVRSPGDESYQKLPFFAERSVTEVLIVQEDRRFELRRLGPDQAYVLVDNGRSETLGVTSSTVAGPRLRIEWEGGAAEV
jgi:Uma2 family endonuclease